MRNTYDLNNLLHMHGISEKLRAQFVGTCMLVLARNEAESRDYTGAFWTANLIREDFKAVLEKLLTGSIDKAQKLTLLNTKVLGSKDVKDLTLAAFREILNFIQSKILPYINDKNTAGQDLLNLFFVTFNKYVGKDDKNQAFTPDHITDFMSKVCGVNKNSVVLDPCCGSGSFLVRAMIQALWDCETEAEKENVRKKQIYGIEYDEDIYGLSTTNMLIHSDGNSNIIKSSCFDEKAWIQDAKPTVILMNPPYNAQRKHMPNSYTNTWASKKKEDPTKGFYFVKYILDTMNEKHLTGKMAVLLPVACAIGTGKEIAYIKREVLKENTLLAVFTLPNEVFYPGASASACCMVFDIGVPHKTSNIKTFFGYYKDDGFKKKKNLGRIEQIDPETGESKWEKIEEQWLELYRDKQAVDGLSAVQKVSGDDEWLCEAYMKTDYTKLTEADFQQTINDYLAYLVKEGNVYEA